MSTYSSATAVRTCVPSSRVATRARLRCSPWVRNRGTLAPASPPGGEHAEQDGEREQHQQHEAGAAVGEPQKRAVHHRLPSRVRGGTTSVVAGSGQRPSRVTRPSAPTSRAVTDRASSQSTARSPRTSAAVEAVLAATQRGTGRRGGAPGLPDRPPGPRVEQVVVHEVTGPPPAHLGARGGQATTTEVHDLAGRVVVVGSLGHQHRPAGVGGRRARRCGRRRRG